MARTYSPKTVLHRWSQKQSRGSNLVYSERKLAIFKVSKKNIEEQLFLQSFQSGFCCMSLYRQFHLLHRRSLRHHHSSNMSIKPLWPQLLRYLHRTSGQSIMDREMQTSLSFRYEWETRMTTLVVRNKPRKYRSSAHLTLLCALPAVRMRKNKIYIRFNWIP